MKTILCLIALAASLNTLRAQDACCGSGACQSSTISYGTPVVYQASVVYQAPVTYYAPVYYMASAAAAACYTGCERPRPSPSTVIHITGGRGTYVTSNYGDCGSFCGSSVVYIGSRYARPGSYRHFNRR